MTPCDIGLQTSMRQFVTLALLALLVSSCLASDDASGSSAMPEATLTSEAGLLGSGSRALHTHADVPATCQLDQCTSETTDTAGRLRDVEIVVDRATCCKAAYSPTACPAGECGTASSPCPLPSACIYFTVT